jgi:hypothetical protein
MSNQVSIYLTKFVTLDLEGNETGSPDDVTYGIRVTDDYDCTYSNLFEKEDVVGKSPKEIVDMARDIDERAGEMITFAENEKDGLSIGDKYYSWGEIKGLTP